MPRRTMRCSFCGRRDSEVAKLVAGPWRMVGGRVYICDRCATQTIQIMEAHSGDDVPRGKTESVFRQMLNWFGWPHADSDNRSECHAT